MHPTGGGMVGHRALFSTCETSGILEIAGQLGAKVGRWTLKDGLRLT